MTAPACITAARRFLSLVSEGDPPSLTDLSRALDELAVAYHRTPPTSESYSDDDPPEQDYGVLYAALGPRFPDLGYYASTDPTVPVCDEQFAGDAIDDLVDIFKDLNEASWRFDHEGAGPACYCYRHLFEIHWGRHLRDLGLYLHAIQFS